MDSLNLSYGDAEEIRTSHQTGSSQFHSIIIYEHYRRCILLFYYHKFLQIVSILAATYKNVH